VLAHVLSGTLNAARSLIHPLESRGNYSATSNNI